MPTSHATSTPVNHVCTAKRGDVRLSLTADQVREPDLANSLRQEVSECSGSLIIELHDLPRHAEDAVIGLLSAVRELQSDHDVRLSVHGKTYRDPFDGVVAAIVPSTNVRRCERARRAAVLAAALFHADAVDVACSHIAQRLRKHGVKGVRVTSLRAEVQALIPTENSAPDSPTALAQSYLESLAGELPDELRPLIYYRSGFLTWTGTHWREESDSRMRASIVSHIQTVTPDKMALSRTVIDVLLALQGLCMLDCWHESPPFLVENEDPLQVTRPQYLVLANGLLDIDGALACAICYRYPHDRAYIATYVLPYAEAPDAECPRWENTVQEILPPVSDADRRIHLLQELFGWCLLVGDMSFQRFFVFFGDGANGKSLILNVLTQMLGTENVSHVPLEQMGGEFRIAEMQGKLANIAADMSRVERSDEGLLKKLTSGDPVSANRKYREPTTFVPTAKLVFATNNLPRFSDRSSGIWRRMIVLPFYEKFSGDDADRQLIDTLVEELPGILNWSLAGLKRLLQQGDFSECAVCRDACQQHRTDSDPFLQFTDAELEFGPGNTVLSSRAHAAYVEFARRSCYQPIGASQFGARMVAYPGVTRKRESTGDRPYFYQGVTLATPVRSRG